MAGQNDYLNRAGFAKVLWAALFLFNFSTLLIGCVSHNCRDCRDLAFKAALYDSLGLVGDTLRTSRFSFSIDRSRDSKAVSTLSGSADCECNSYIISLTLNQPLLNGVDTIPMGTDLNDISTKTKISDVPKRNPPGTYDNSLILFKPEVRLKRGKNEFYLVAGKQGGEFRDTLVVFVPEALGY